MDPPVIPSYRLIDDPHPDGSQEGVVTDVKGNIYGSLTGGQALRRYVKN